MGGQEPKKWRAIWGPACSADKAPSMLTPRGGLKPIRGVRRETGQLDLGGRGGWGNDHFTTTGMRDNSSVAQSRLYVKRTKAPNKNQDSEPGLWGSKSDFPPLQTFTTTRELMDAPKGTQPIRDSCRAAKSDMRLGYPEAEAKNPWKSSSMKQYKDPLLGARKKGPTAIPQPNFPAPEEWSHPITGHKPLNQRTCLFDRFQRDEKKTRISCDQLYKSAYNPSNSSVNLLTGYKSMAKTHGNTAQQKLVHAKPTPS